jgi:N-acetylmuramoyl-L-alanine amidase
MILGCGCLLLTQLLLSTLVMPFLSRSLTSLVPALVALVGGFAFSAPALAVEFGQQPIDPNLVVAMATPVPNGNFYRLVILEQMPNQRQCWDEQGDSPIRIDPLLLNFDFNGACDRKTDSNGYSIRVNNRDLSLDYRLDISRRQNDLVLLARAIRDRSAPAIEVGRTNGMADGSLKINLNPGWRMAYRTYNGEVLGHIYLTHDAPLDNTRLASREAIINTPPPANPLPPSNSPPAPTGTTPPAPPLQTPPPPTSAPPRAGDTQFRVVVPMTASDTLERARRVEPEAFRASVDGQTMVQVGLFRDRQRAEEIHRDLVAANLPAKILTTTAAAPASLPPIPAIPQGQVVVVIDPGHGGRDPGAIGIGGLREKDINIVVSNRVQQRLREAGLAVLMTRSSDQWVDLDPRAEYANRAGADVFVSIHANAINMSRPDVNGLETYYYATGQRLAQSIHNSVLRSTDLGDRGVRQARFYVLRHTDMPAVLVETGFLTGATDAARFRNPDAVNQIGDAIARGVLDYLGR